MNIAIEGHCNQGVGLVRIDQEALDLRILVLVRTSVCLQYAEHLFEADGCLNQLALVQQIGLELERFFSGAAV